MSYQSPNCLCLAFPMRCRESSARPRLCLWPIQCLQLNYTSLIWHCAYTCVLHIAQCTLRAFQVHKYLTFLDWTGLVQSLPVRPGLDWIRIAALGSGLVWTASNQSISYSATNPITNPSPDPHSGPLHMSSGYSDTYS